MAYFKAFIADWATPNQIRRHNVSATHIGLVINFQIFFSKQPKIL